MGKKYAALALVLTLCYCGHRSDAVAAESSTPNILFILVDDLAWADLGCFGHPWHQTPNIDRLASDGLCLTNGYAPAPICSASRASIMTGKSTARLGFEFVTKPDPGRQPVNEQFRLRTPPFTLNLPTDEITIAERLNQLGYETAFFGKWHLNQHYQRYLGWSPTHGPKAQGFQVAVEDFGAHPYSWGKSEPEPIVQDGVYADDTMVNNVCDYLKKDRGEPFFVMASSFYVHTPVKTPCKWLVDRYDRTVPSSIKRRPERLRYAAFLQTLDFHIGAILDALEASGKADNTLVFFMSDNGGHPEFTTNGPLRGSKWNVYEGGIRVPMIARLPGKTAAGTSTAAPVIGYDLLPTFVDYASGPDDGKVDASKIDGISIRSVLEGNKPTKNPRELVWHFPYYHPERGFAKAKQTIGTDDLKVSQTRPQSALRYGNHKLIWFAEDKRFELYDLANDLAEQHDLSSSHSELAKQMQSRLFRYLDDVGARLPVDPKETQ
ncbi:sulfatase [Stieleria sp. JC731]|uniref:sulfatase n=1 Tax=Pirellulaceae TaxID=2691357 RepID=UPI001E496104|nr:sulfatase [Stieleria sp. JC731]MCC9603907.1 sulfatase [Stieleria sp. JC731]